MYDIKRVRKEFKEICAQQGVNVLVPIEQNGRLTRTLGRVMYKKERDYIYPYKVEFSKELITLGTDDSISEVIKHEACHYIVTSQTHEQHGHDSVFKAMCEKVGTKNSGPTTAIERTVDKEQLFKYAVYCPNCDKNVAHYKRMCRTLKLIDYCKCPVCQGHNLEIKENW